MESAMGKRLSGKTILITGASSGIGKSCAEEFARTSPESLKLVLTARRIDNLNAIAVNINKSISSKVKVHCARLDMTNPGEISSFISNLPSEFKDIDVLLNNAGLGRGVDQAPYIDPEDIDVMFATNVTGLVAMTQAVLPMMKKRGQSGAGDIINIGSIAGRQGYPGGSIYCATKAAVRIFTDALRKELIATRIRVIEIGAGQVETEFSLIRARGDKTKADAVYSGVTPLTPDDIAEIVVFAAGRRENVVFADSLLFPNHQASATVLHRKS
ncbi:hypothetical protein MMC08_000957 [Hypocenomyce scalaris]|nr:hypothetical protein [Hypocenomyce scalaris]